MLTSVIAPAAPVPGTLHVWAAFAAQLCSPVTAPDTFEARQSPVPRFPSWPVKRAVGAAVLGGVDVAPAVHFCAGEPLQGCSTRRVAVVASPCGPTHRPFATFNSPVLASV